MAYEPKTWESGEVITAEDLNHLEGGVEDANAILPEATASDNGKVLGVDNGEYALVEQSGGIGNTLKMKSLATVNGTYSPSNDKGFSDWSGSASVGIDAFEGKTPIAIWLADWNGSKQIPANKIGVASIANANTINFLLGAYIYINSPSSGGHYELSLMCVLA